MFWFTLTDLISIVYSSSRWLFSANNLYVIAAQHQTADKGNDWLVNIVEHVTVIWSHNIIFVNLSAGRNQHLNPTFPQTPQLFFAGM